MSTAFGAYPASPSLDGRRDQMFPALADHLVARIAEHAREATFDAGALVWEIGDEATPFYVVLEGQLEIVHPDGATERPVTIHERGEFTGEMALLFGRRTLVRARAKTALRVLVVEPQPFRKLVQTEPALGEIVMRAFILRRLALLSEGWGDAVVVGSRDSAETLRLQASSSATASRTSTSTSIAKPTCRRCSTSSTSAAATSPSSSAGASACSSARRTPRSPSVSGSTRRSSRCACST